jgi:hypothetical protein
VSRDPQRWRGALSFILLTLSVLCLVLGSLFVWMRATAFTPDGYVSKALTVQGESLLSEKVTNFVKDDVLPQDKADDLAMRVVDPLPLGADEKKLLATAVAATVRSQVGNAVNAFFESGPGVQFTEALSTRLSEEIVKLVDNGSGIFDFEGDSIVLDTQPIAQGARAKAEDLLGPLARFLPPPPESYKQVVLVQGDYVVTIQKAINLIWLMSWLLPTLFAVLLALGLFVARERRPAAFRTAIAIIVGVAIAVIAIRIARSVITGLIQEGPNQDVVDAILTAATINLVDQTLLIVVITAIVGFVLWLFGPDKPARYARGWIAQRGRDLVSGERTAAGRVTEFARRYRAHLDIAGVVLTVLALIVVPNLTGYTWAFALIALAIWLLLIELAACPRWLQAVARWIHGLRHTSTTS